MFRRPQNVEVQISSTVGKTSVVVFPWVFPLENGKTGDVKTKLEIAWFLRDRRPASVRMVKISCPAGDARRLENVVSDAVVCIVAVKNNKRSALIPSTFTNASN